MQSTSFYKYAAGILLILNIGIVTFFLVTKPSQPPLPHEGRLQGEIIDLLQLTEQQAIVFREYAQKHDDKMTALNHTQQTILRAYFQVLKRDSSVIPQQGLLDKALQVERNKILSTVKHFQKVKAMLKPEQKAHFKPFMDKVLEVILLNQKKNPPRPKDF
ncbi:hypothetical protein BKI52_21405 [marine bacterium AO1-C]|nr:hypothetical protein BKI52_21405 [marine bacterium AO1-C]